METFHNLLTTVHYQFYKQNSLIMYARKLELSTDTTYFEKQRKKDRLEDTQIKKIRQNATCRIEVVGIRMFIIELFCMLEILY